MVCTRSLPTMDIDSRDAQAASPIAQPTHLERRRQQRRRPVTGLGPEPHEVEDRRLGLGRRLTDWHRNTDV
jgi:hypothetical protein